MNAAEAAIAAGRTDESPIYLTETLAGGLHSVWPGGASAKSSDGDAGITTPVLVPLSPDDGNQMNGLKAVFAAFER